MLRKFILKKKRRSNIKQAMKKMENAGEELEGVQVSKDPKRAELELKMLGIAQRVKEEGIE